MTRRAYFDDPENRAWALELFSLGLSQGQAAERMGISYRTIIRWLNDDPQAHAHFVRTRPEPELRHGTTTGYGSKWMCRCPACTAANTATHRMWEAKVRGKPPSHGTNAYRNYGCRCDVCKAAQSVRNKQYRDRQSSIASQ